MLVMALSQSRQDHICIQQSGVISLLQDWFLQTIPRVPWQAERSSPLLAMALALRWGRAAVSPGPNKGAISMMPIRPFCLCCLQSPALFRRKARKQARPAQQSGGSLAVDSGACEAKGEACHCLTPSFLLGVKLVLRGRTFNANSPTPQPICIADLPSHLRNQVAPQSQNL